MCHLINGGEYPPTAGQWANPNINIPGWEVVNYPQRGDIIAIANETAFATGHVGIVSGGASTISATPSDGVVNNDWGFRSGQNPVFRHYTGE